MPTKSTPADKIDQGLNIVDLCMYLVSKWKWFLLSVLIFGGIAYVKYASSTKVYFRSATVIIKDPSNKTSTASLDRYENLVNKVNVANEILQFQSKRLMREVVQRVHADVNYQIKDGLRLNELYTQGPVTVSFVDSIPGRYISFTVTPKDANTVILSNFSGADAGRTIEARLNQVFRIKQGRLIICPTTFYGKTWYDTDIHVTKLPLDQVTATYQASLGIRQEEDESSILNLSLKDNNPARAEDVLNMLITVYNEEAIKDKNQVAVNTANFINERLIIISQELGAVESNLESFKRANQVVDLNSSATRFMDESQKYGSDALELETQLRLAQYIKQYIVDPKRDLDLIPSNTGLSDMNIEGQIGQYNTIKLRRDKLVDDSSESNPVVEELNNSLRAMKQNIIRAVDNLIVSINVKRNDAASREMRAQSRVAQIPTKERQMLGIERQQKIKEALYLFLLNRREENALSQAMADNNARIIDAAEGSNAPIAPNRNRIMLLGVLFGLAVPGVVFLSILFLDTRVHSRKDIEGNLSVPYLGDVPLDPEQKKRSKKDKNDIFVVDENGDSLLSEAFRILRTNIAFMAKKGRPQQVITFTSFNESAGKTFISLNLAMSYVYAKKRVIVIDLDMRKRTLTHRLGAHSDLFGVTNYLADPSLQLSDVIRQGEHFDFITAGIQAPNPAELLMDSRLDELIEKLRALYDIIIVDNVPVGIIADSIIANRIADLTIFVVRAGRFDRRQLPDVEKIYQDHKLQNMAILLNGAEHHHGYGYGYGYGYGHYGYGYGHRGKKNK